MAIRWGGMPVLAAMGLAAFAGWARAAETPSARLSLNEAIVIATENNKSLAEARAGVELSLGREAEAKAADGFNVGISANKTVVRDDASFPAAIYPSVIVADVNGQNQSVAGLPPDVMNVDISSPESGTIDLTVSRPVHTWGKIEGGRRVAALGVSLAGLDLEQVRQDVIFRTRTGFHQSLLAEKAVGVARESLANASKHRGAAEAKYLAGAAPLFDVIRANVEVERAREDLRIAERQSSLARLNFNNILGTDLDADAPLEDWARLEIQPLKVLEDCLKLALENRIELKALELRGGQLTAKNQIDRLSPDLGFFTQWNLLNQGGGAFGSENSWRLGLQATVPLFDNGSARAKIEQNRAGRKQLEIAASRLRDGLHLQVKDAYLSVAEAEQRINSSNAVLTAAEEARRIASVGFDEGAVSGLDLIDAEHNLTQSKLNAAKARADYETALARLSHAVGTPDMARIFAP